MSVAGEPECHSWAACSLRVARPYVQCRKGVLLVWLGQVLVCAIFFECDLESLPALRAFVSRSLLAVPLLPMSLLLSFFAIVVTFGRMRSFAVEDLWVAGRSKVKPWEESQGELWPTSACITCGAGCLHTSEDVST